MKTAERLHPDRPRERDEQERTARQRRPAPALSCLGGHESSCAGLLGGSRAEPVEIGAARGVERGHPNGAPGQGLDPNGEVQRTRPLAALIALQSPARIDASESKLGGEVAEAQIMISAPFGKGEVGHESHSSHNGYQYVKTM